MNVLLNLKFYILRKFNKGEPSRKECLWSLSRIRTPSQNIKDSLELYGKGFSLEYIALCLNVTRERVRQLIRKGCRIARES